MRSFYGQVLAAGVQVLEYQPAMLNAKLLVIDRELALVGSANLDNRSLRLNFETDVAIYDRATAEALATTLTRDATAAHRVELRQLARRGSPARFAESAARLFATVL